MTELNAETPAEGIMKTYQNANSICYRVDCTCGSEDDSIEFAVETDFNDIVVSTYTTQKTDWWSDPANKNKSYNYDNEFLFNLNYIVRGWINGLVHRLKWSWRLWVDGYIKYQSTIIMTKQQALNYAKALESAIAHLEEQQNELVRTNDGGES